MPGRSRADVESLDVTLAALAGAVSAVSGELGIEVLVVPDLLMAVRGMASS